MELSHIKNSYLLIGALVLAALAVLAYFVLADDGPTCDKGKRCGDTCIARDKECHVD